MDIEDNIGQYIFLPYIYTMQKIVHGTTLYREIFGIKYFFLVWFQYSLSYTQSMR